MSHLPSPPADESPDAPTDPLAPSSDEYRHPPTLLVVGVVVPVVVAAVGVTAAANGALRSLPWLAAVGVTVVAFIVLVGVLFAVPGPSGRVGVFLKLFAVTMFFTALVPFASGTPGVVSRMISVDLTAGLCFMYAHTWAHPQLSRARRRRLRQEIRADLDRRYGSIGAQ